MADTLIPTVPSAVIKPMMTIKFLIILAITVETFVSGFVAWSKFFIPYCTTLLKNQKSMKLLSKRIY